MSVGAPGTKGASTEGASIEATLAVVGVAVAALAGPRAIAALVAGLLTYFALFGLSLAGLLPTRDGEGASDRAN